MVLRGGWLETLVWIAGANATWDGRCSQVEDLRISLLVGLCTGPCTSQMWEPTREENYLGIYVRIRIGSRGLVPPIVPKARWLV